MIPDGIKVRKIAPFALWMHLQRIDASFATQVNARMLLPESLVRRHFHLHCAALIVLLAAVLVPALSHLAGGLVVASFAWLDCSLVKLVRKGPSPGPDDSPRNS